MITMNLFYEIKNYKRKGYKIRPISKRLGISRNTTKKYFEMSEDEFLKYSKELKSREKVYEEYKDEIISIFNTNQKKVYTSSVFDLLIETYGKDKLPGTERTLRNYIKWLKNIGEISNTKIKRPYKPVLDLQFGKQLQLDFGQLTINTGDTVYIFASVLSASKYKYVAVQNTPFRTIDVICHLIDCFDYIEGVPEEIVIDQDKTMVINENAGDITLTRMFKQFKDEMGFNLYVCRKADPETKGRVENLVKYVKTNFFSARSFNRFSEVESRLRSWLDNRANNKICSDTKMSYSNLFQIEKESLKPVRASIFKRENILFRETRKVDSKSLISVKSSMYSVPIKYRNTTIWIHQTDRELFIYDDRAGNIIAKHQLSLIPGQKIINNNHYRDTTRDQLELKIELLSKFEIDSWKKFIELNYKKCNRYFREQYGQIKIFLSNEIDEYLLERALELCFETEKYTAKNLEEAYLYHRGVFEDSHSNILSTLVTGIKAIKEDSRNPKVKKRELSYYSSLISILGGLL